MELIFFFYKQVKLGNVWRRAKFQGYTLFPKSSKPPLLGQCLAERWSWAVDVASVDVWVNGLYASTLCIFPVWYLPCLNWKHKADGQYCARCVRRERRNCLSAYILQTMETAAI